MGRVKIGLTSLIPYFIILFGAPGVFSGIPLSDFYPYSEATGCSTWRSFGDDNALDVAFTAPFKLFNRTHWSTFISSNGLISFGLAVTSAWSNCQGGIVPKIVPFWADANEVGNGDRITYGEIQDDAIHRKAVADIVTGFPQFRRGATVTWMFVVTWLNVVKIGGPVELQNTFQLVLVTLTSNGRSHSFVIFNYQKLTWGFKSDRSYFSLAGFDYGNGERMPLFIGSCKTGLLNLTEGSNINPRLHPGKFLFRVDSNFENPSSSDGKLLGDCGKHNKGFLGDPENRQVLRLEPFAVPISGSIPVIVHGPCFSQFDNVTCSFRNAATNGQDLQTVGVVFPDQVTICPVPLLHSLGRLQVSLLVKSNSTKGTTTYSGVVYVLKDNEFGQLPVISLSKSLEENGSFLSAHWDPEIVQIREIQKIDEELVQGEESTNGTIGCHKLSDFVQIVLQEFDGRTWRELGPVSPLLINNGLYMQPLNGTHLDQLTSGTRGKIRRFALKVTHKLASVNETDLVKTIPSAIFLSKNDNSTSADNLCQQWYNKESPSPRDQLPCPLTTTQAHHDWIFEIDKLSSTAWLASNVSVVYLQKLASPSGAVAQCLYNEDDLLMANVPSVLRQSPNSGRGSFWSYYSKEMMPFTYCCEWSSKESKSCEKYRSKRQPAVNSGYLPPTPARISGGGHVSTFDGLDYTLDGRPLSGEFWLLKYDDPEEGTHLHIQVRLKLLTGVYAGDVKTTIFATAIVAHEASDGHDVKIQVEAPTSFSPGSSHLSLKFGNDEALPLSADTVAAFSKVNLRQSGVSVVLLSPEEMVVTFLSGISCKISASGSVVFMLNVVCTAAEPVKNKTEGLWGGFNGRTEDDLRLPNGTSLEFGEDIPGEFASAWKTTLEESLFASDPEGIARANHTTLGITSDLSPTNEMVAEDITEMCNGLQECISDYLRTGDEILAQGGKGVFTLYQEIRNMTKFQVGQCEKVVNVTNGEALVASFVVGGKAELRCDRGFKLQSFDNSDKSNMLTCSATNDTEPRAEWRSRQGKVSSAICTSPEEVEDRREVTTPTVTTITTEPTTKMTTPTVTITTTEPTTILTSVFHETTTSVKDFHNKTWQSSTSSSSELHPGKGSEKMSTYVRPPAETEETSFGLLIAAGLVATCVVLVVLLLIFVPGCRSARTNILSRLSPGAASTYNVSMRGGLFQESE